MKEYSGYASNIFISEGVGDIGVGKIREKLDRFIHFNEGGPPAVIVDYAQILAPANEKYTDKQNTDKNVLELKRISRTIKSPFLQSAHSTGRITPNPSTWPVSRNRGLLNIRLTC